MGVRSVDLRKGTVLEKDGDLLLITEYTHKTPGNLRAIIQIKTKSLTTGQSNTMRLSSSDTMDVAFLERRKTEYLYRESNGDYIFMNSDDYEQFPLSAEFVGDKMGFVKENTEVEVTFHESVPIGVALPNTVTLRVVEAEQAVKGNTATNVRKGATLETGLEVKVPIHVVAGDLIKISTENAEFQGRIKE